jgi:hypothetical protein
VATLTYTSFLVVKAMWRVQQRANGVLPHVLPRFRQRDRDISARLFFLSMHIRVPCHEQVFRRQLPYPSPPTAFPTPCGIPSVARQSAFAGASTIEHPSLKDLPFTFAIVIISEKKGSSTCF